MALEGKLTKERIPELERALRGLATGQGAVTIDLAAVTEADSAGAALLSAFARELKETGRVFKIQNVAPAVEKTLDLFPFVEQKSGPEPTGIGLVERAGGLLAEVLEIGLAYLVLCADTAWFTIHSVIKRRGIRYASVFYEMSQMGSRAVLVVGLIAFLIGGTMALQSAMQLRQFGANIFVADLIGISMTRELGPLMAAIVVAGRSGSAVAAEIGTMVITEEVDALKTMGLHPTRFLVVPKTIAIAITQPMLTMMADIVGIFGGFLVAVLYLDVAPDAFVTRMQQSLQLKDILTGLLKSVIFAGLIVTIGALCGFRTRGGADAVGRSTTTSVVAGIFAVIAADAITSIIFYFGD